MKITLRKFKWMSLSFAIAMLTGTPALADDTELLLVNPDPASNPKPNVMFILDTSGSMTSTQWTIDPYDSTDTYTGDCDPDDYYWTDVDVTPDCATTSNVVRGDKYVCEFSMLRLTALVVTPIRWFSIVALWSAAISEGDIGRGIQGLLPDSWCR